MTSPVQSAHNWASNAELIADVARLGYLRKEWFTLDATYGPGVFWKLWRPNHLITNDFKASTDAQFHEDFREMGFEDETFDAIVLDPDYKLNGTPSAPDVRYGADVKKSWQERHQDIRDGMTEMERMLMSKGRKQDNGILLVKCQDQVCSGAIRWQTREFADHGESLGLTLIDRFDLLGKGRAQPKRTRQDGKPSKQKHAYGRPSTLLVFQKRGGYALAPLSA